MRWLNHRAYRVALTPLLGASFVLSGCSETDISRVQQPIVAELMSPSTGDSFYEGEEVLITGRVSDPNPGGAEAIATVHVVATLGSATVSGNPDAQGQVSLRLNTTGQDSGKQYSLKLAGSRPDNPHSSVAAAVISLLPNTPPVGELLAPAQSQHLYAGSPVKLTLSLADAETRYSSWQLSATLNGAAMDLSDLSLEPQGSDHQALASFWYSFEEGSAQSFSFQITDGFGKQVVLRRQLDVGPPNRNPGPCEITGPDSSISIYEGQNLLLEGQSTDPDQTADSLTYLWIDGQSVIAQGNPSHSGYISSSIAQGLSAGSHSITLSIVDELGASCEARRSFEVLSKNGAPEVEILYPSADLGEGAVLNEEQRFRFEVQARDEEDGQPLLMTMTLASQSEPIAGLSCENSNSGVSSQGWYAYDYLCQFPASSLPLNQAVTLYAHATDSDGLKVSARIVVQVLPCVDSDGDGYTTCQEPGCDSDPTVNPGVQEVCDGIDNNCDKVVDADAINRQTYYRDADGDGFGLDAQSATACTQPVGYAARGGDCNDAERAINPGASELCGDGIDNNCDGQIDESADLDGDGYNACVDCNDKDASIHPGATERCDGLDTNCDGAIPSEERDHDGDGWVACLEACDTDPARYPGKTELCNGVDDDCNGALPADELDSDGDGYLNCQEPGCQDDANRGPNQPELCNGLDDNCDGLVDEGLDADGDGYLPCSVAGSSADCDDGNKTIYPGADEICDGIDANCDGNVDSDAQFDTDEDGVSYCMGDCNDDDPRVSSETEESFDGIDNDCNGQTDDLLIENVAGGYHTGDAQRQLVGNSMTGVGDINADGYLDFVLGAPRYGVIVDGNSEASLTGLGRAYVFLGSSSAPTRNNNLSASSSRFTGEREEDEAAYAVAGLGDINGDGVSDFAVGARNNRKLTSGAPAQTGATYVFFGCKSSTQSGCMKGNAQGELTPDLKIQGIDALSQSGSAVAPAGDVNGDGLADFLIGAPEFNDVDKPDAGVVFLFLGRSSGWGDMTLSNADVRFIASDQGDHLGAALAAIPGDVNGDGFDDIVLGAPSTGGVGRVFVFYGTPTLKVRSNGPLQLPASEADLVLVGESPGAAGAALALGDLNSDGFDEVVVGAPELTGLDGSVSSPNAGRVYVVFGSDDMYGTFTLDHAGLIIEGDNQPAQLGFSLAAGQDVDGDGLEDLLIGAPGWSTPAYTEPTFLGRAYLLLGDQMLGTEALLRTSDLSASFAGGTPGRSGNQLATDPMNTDKVASKVSMAGDLYRTDSGLPSCADLLISAPYYDGDSSDRGRAYVVLGKLLEH